MVRATRMAPCGKSANCAGSGMMKTVFPGRGAGAGVLIGGFFARRNGAEAVVIAACYGVFELGRR